MQTAEALDEPPPATSAATLDPYGQLIRMLMPRAQSIAVYDRVGQPVWLSDGLDAPELHRLLQETLAEELAHGSRGDCFTETIDRAHSAHTFLLRDPEGDVLGAVGVVSRESVQRGEARSAELVQGLLRPVLECLRRELASQLSIGDLRRSLSTRDRDLEILLGGAPGEGSAGESTDDFGQLLHGCIEHLGCSVGALLIPDRNIAVCRTGGGTKASVGADVLTRTHRHLLAWAQLNLKTMMGNQPPADGPLASLPYKVLSCPVMQGSQRLLGVLALFKPLDAPDFDLRQLRLVELLARRFSYVLQNAYDAATGLLTRPAFEKRAQLLLAPDSPGTQHCVIYVDIDHLHVLNENHGMHVGDEVIMRVAEAMRRSLPPRMLAARISGDRFALFAGHSSLDKAQEFADSLRVAVEKLECVADSKPVGVSASFGVAAVAAGKQSLSHALAAAEIACKAAKDRGRNRVEVFEESDKSILRRYTDVSLIGTLQDALANDRFRLDAQAVVPLTGADGRPRFELLLRMTDPACEQLSPDKFLCAAERYQIAPAIDRWVVQRVLATLKPHADRLARVGACFSVNISGQSIGDQEFTGFLERELRASNLPPWLLSFELTETAAVANIVRAELLIRRLRDLGCRVALDDFGKGLSSLTYLKTLPVTTIKIDGSFVRDVVVDERSHAMLSAIVALAQAMGLETVAECVESHEIRDITRRLGVQYGQGFAIARPIPFEQVIGGLTGDKIQAESPRT